MKLLSVQQILELHVLVISETGGSNGLREMGPIESVVASQHQVVFDEVLYKTVFEKAAAMMRGIIAGHPFVDGNKRTGALTALTLLDMNGYRMKIAKGDLEDFAVKVATDHLSVEDIAKWLEKHTTISRV